VPSQGRFGRVLSSEAAVPSSSTRVVASCPSRIHAQLRNPGDPGDGYHDTATDGGDQQRHSQREGAREAQVVNLHPRRVLQNEDDEHRQEQECGSRGNPSGADASYSWRTFCGRRAGSGRRWRLLRCLGSRRGRVSRHDSRVPSKSRSALSGPMTCRRPLAAWGLTRPGARPISSCARRARRATAEGVGRASRSGLRTRPRRRTRDSSSPAPGRPRRRLWGDRTAPRSSFAPMSDW
jgi:hypothetical protein